MEKNNLKVLSPFDGHFIKEVEMTTERQAEDFLQRSYELSRNTSGRLEKYRRIEILEKLAGKMEDNLEELARRAAEEGGKPLVDSLVETRRAINGVKLAVSALYDLKGDEVPMGLTAPSVNRLAFTVREPIGVVLAISAFNHPLNLIIHQVIPAVATGCPVLVKPASSTPLSCLELVNMLYECGLPEDLCVPLVVKRDMAARLAADRRIGFLTFIGSHEVGWGLRSNLAPGTRIALEHGGVAPVIIDRSAEIDPLIGDMLKAGYYHAGQVCVSVQKMFVHRDIIGQVSERMVKGATGLRVGDPLDRETDVGPLIDRGEVERVNEWVRESVSQGGELLCGGEVLSPSLYSPTVLLDPPDNAIVSREEVFGPVVCLYPFDDITDAVTRANSLKYAFQSAVYTKDIDVAMEVSRELNASTVMINDHTAFRVDWMPFGGRDESGLGLGGIPFTMRDMTREKLIVIKSRRIP